MIEAKETPEEVDSFAEEAKKEQLELFDWQKRAKQYFFKHNKALFSVCTGAGKTFISIDIIKDILKKHPNYQVLIVVPKNVILEQGWYKELVDAGIPIQDVGVYYGDVKEYAKITITNMQNLHRIQLDLFDVAIFDECHNYGTKRLLPYLKRDFHYKLGLTATVERMDNAHYDVLECFDYNRFEYAPKQALFEGVLNPFKFYNIKVIMDPETAEQYEKIDTEVRALMKAGGGFNKIMRSNTGAKYKLLAKMNVRKELVNNYEKKFEVVKWICKQHPESKIIVFNEYNKQTSKCYWHLLDHEIEARIIHSGIDQKKRDKNLIDFRNDKFKVLLTTKVLDEGFNLPSIDVGIIMAGNSTAKQTIQRMGRVLRKKDTSSVLYQVYVADTIEEDYALQRAKLFKELCMDFEEYEVE